MNKIKVVNIKCGGCAGKIENEMKKAGLSNIRVNINEQTVEFEGEENLGKKLLSTLGYPPVDSPEAKSLLKKGKSFVSCMIGRVNKN